MKFFPIIGILILLISCDQEKNKLSAQQIIDKTIENAGGEKYENSKIEFKFREANYSSFRKGGEFELTRQFKDSLGEIKDVLSNAGFKRFINNEEISLPDSTKTKYSNSVNSVHYFIQLPYGLNASAVKKELIGESVVKDEKYYKIKVTFAEEGGGDDHDDIYMYWINKNEFTVDYFAYKFYTGKGGIRFREAYNPRIVEGLRFVDYKNYKVEPWETVDLKDLDNLFETGKLELLSNIETENIKVSKVE
jgi:hypothetical protein